MAILIIAIIIKNRPLAFVLIIFDMLDYGLLINPNALGFAGVLKFKDFELALLFITILLLIISPPEIKKSKNELTKLYKLFAIIFLIIFIYSLTFQNLAFVLRSARNITVYFIFFSIPFFIRDKDDFKIVIYGFLICMMLSSTTHILQTIIFPKNTLLPFAETTMLSGRINRLYGSTQPFNLFGLFVLITYLSLNKNNSIKLNLMTIIVFLAIILTFTRSYSLFAIFGIFLLVIIVKNKQNTLFTIKNLIAFSLVTIIFLSLLSIYSTKGNDLFYSFSDRSKDNTFFYHVDYIFTSNELIKFNNGSVLLGLGFQLINRGKLLSGGNDIDELFSTFNSDSGWATLNVTMGLLGVLFFIYFLMIIIKLTYKLLRSDYSILIKSLSGSLFVYCVFVPILWLVSAHGLWYESALVLTLNTGLLERGLTLNV
jgi:hypothetical protein